MDIKNHSKFFFFAISTWVFLFIAGYISPYLFSNYYTNKSVVSRASNFQEQSYFQNSFTTKQVTNSLLQAYSAHTIETILACKQKSTAVSELENPDSYTALVDKTYKLPADYEPNDLVVLAYGKYPVIKDIYLRKDAAYALIAMINNIEAGGINVRINSGWRTYENQVAAYNLWVSLVGVEAANEFAALPGHSEHQLGTTVDIVTSENNYKTTPEFANTKAGKWLQDNAHLYGFVMSYPKNKSDITSYGFEPWHFRYVGIDHANKIKTDKITATEYFYSINGICI